MFLIVTNERDLTSDYVVLELSRRGLPFCRLNSERLSEARVSNDPKQGEDSWYIEIHGTRIEFSKIRAAYFRRPGSPVSPMNIKGESARHYCEIEWGSVLASALNSLNGRWLNSPLAILASENKPRQLSVAHKLGFSVPDTLITNNFSLARNFLSSKTGVVKPLREALLDDGERERVIFTSRVAGLADSDEEKVTAAPIIFQREIHKHSDIRATVVGDSVYAAEIFSQEYDDTKVDWRKGSNPDLPHKVHKLPGDVKKKCVHLARELGLRFGAVDLVLDKEGGYWFLEINPNGQWAWIENRTQLPLTQAIVDELERIARCSQK